MLVGIEVGIVIWFELGIEVQSLLPVHTLASSVPSRLSYTNRATAWTQSAESKWDTLKDNA